MKKIIQILLLTIIFSCSKEEVINDSINTPSSEDPSYTLWSGNIKTFTKNDDVDPNIAENQDRLTPNVWITRDNDGGQIYNTAKESSADKSKSPIGTEWAIGSIDQLSTLKFDSFRSAVDKPKDVIDKELVLHLLEDDIYLTVKFKSWSQGKKGGFSYERSTP
jgi:hypothetical protein